MGMKTFPAFGLFASLLPGFLASCASISYQHVGVPVKDGRPDSLFARGDESRSSPLKITMEMDEDLSSEYFGFFFFTLENKSDHWLVLKDIRYHFPLPAQDSNTQSISGAPFAQWYESMAKSLEIRGYKRDLALVGIAGVGYGLAALSKNKTAQIAGAAVGTAALATSVHDAVETNLDALQNPSLMDNQSLLADSILVPPGLFVKRWLLLNSTHHKVCGYISDLHLAYSSTDGGRDTVQFHFRDFEKGLDSPWQKQLWDTLNVEANKAKRRRINQGQYNDGRGTFQ